MTARTAPDAPAAGPPPPCPRGRTGPWLPLLLMLFLGVLTVQVVADAGPLPPLDRAVRNHVDHLAASLPWLDGTMHALADLGSPLWSGLVLVAAAVLAFVRGVRSPAPYLAVAAGVAVTSVLVVVGKNAIDRPGPSGGFTYGGQWGYFPSGHTATSAICFGSAALLIGFAVGPRTRRIVYGVAVAACALVGFALVWCRYHWMGDVLASWALVGTILWVCSRLARLSDL